SHPTLRHSLFFFYTHCPHPALLSFPTRRSSDLRHNLYDIADDTLEGQIDDVQNFLKAQHKDASIAKLQEEVTETYILEHSGDYRSEEHTSELQSRGHLVCRLLLEKKKKQNKNKN